MNAWQDILAIALVLAASGFVLWRAWLAIAGRRAAGCGSGCAKCPSSSAGPVLQIDASGSRPDEREKRASR
jgi:hypothetical protein